MGGEIMEANTFLTPQRKLSIDLITVIMHFELPYRFARFNRLT
jgi:hypothetical protein